MFAILEKRGKNYMSVVEKHSISVLCCWTSHRTLLCESYGLGTMIRSNNFCLVLWNGVAIVADSLMAF
jgi:hypothetical protein